MPQAVQDVRTILDDQTLDAVVIATPDPGHAPVTVRARQAGKDVYVEKPITHSAWEGRKMVEAAGKYKRNPGGDIANHGLFPSRSEPRNVWARR